MPWNFGCRRVGPRRVTSFLSDRLTRFIRFTLSARELAREASEPGCQDALMMTAQLDLALLWSNG